MRFERLSLYLVVLGLFVNVQAYGDDWQTVRKNRDLTIWVRHRSGSPLEELRAMGELDAPVRRVQTILSDVSKYSEFMPYLKEARVLSSGNGLCYMLFSPPLVGDRDCTIRVHQESRKDEGVTAYYLGWELANADGPPPRPGVSRLSINEGSWLLESLGNRTKATYTLYTEGGGIPAFVANIANKQGISQLFEALRERLSKPDGKL